MTPALMNLINAIVLISMSFYGYISSETPSPTALIPAVIGLILLFCYNGVKNHNKVIAHVAVVLTLLIIISLIKPLTSAMNAGRDGAMYRILVMMVSSTIALVVFILSFIEARKARNSGN